MAKLTKNKTSTGVDISQQHSSNDFMNCFTSKINTIRDQTVTMQLPFKFVKSAKPTTCMLDPIPSKLLKEVLAEVIDPLLAIINSSLPF